VKSMRCSVTQLELEEAFCGWADLFGYSPELGALVAIRSRRRALPDRTDE
jgi:hypothetical protein